MTERITELRRALQMAADRLNHCWAELDRYEPNGPDYRNTERKLKDDVLIAQADVELLSRELTRAVEGQFDALIPGSCRQTRSETGGYGEEFYQYAGTETPVFLFR